MFRDHLEKEQVYIVIRLSYFCQIDRAAVFYRPTSQEDFLDSSSEGYFTNAARIKISVVIRCCLSISSNRFAPVSVPLDSSV